jgi:hypothetical protein
MIYKSIQGYRVNINIRLLNQVLKLLGQEYQDVKYGGFGYE